jgi:hypothetical protein
MHFWKKINFKEFETKIIFSVQVLGMLKKMNVHDVVVLAYLRFFTPLSIKGSLPFIEMTPYTMILDKD